MTKDIMIKRISKEERQILNEYSRDFNWIFDNRERLTRLYPNHYIAVKDKAVIYTETDMERLCMMMELGGDDPAFWIVDYMNVKPINIILVGAGGIANG